MDNGYKALIKTLKKDLPAVMNEHRYAHTVSVSIIAAILGTLYGEDAEKCELCGLLHDAAKGIPETELILLCEKNGVELSEGEKAAPKVIHAPYGAYLARVKYGIEDADILNAIRFHTTGRENMSTLEKIIYIADFIEPGRREAECLYEARRAAFTDLDRCMAVILKNTVQYLKGRGQRIEEHTLSAYRFYGSEDI